MAGAPWDKIVTLGNLTAGVDNYVMVPAPPRGVITKVVASGPSSGFTLDIFNSKDAIPSNASSDSAEGVTVYSQELYKVLPTITTNNAKAEVFNVRYPYENQEFNGRNRDYKLYVRVNPVGGTSVQLALAIESIATI